MKIPITLMVLTVIVLVIGAFALANTSQDDSNAAFPAAHMIVEKYDKHFGLKSFGSEFEEIVIDMKEEVPKPKSSFRPNKEQVKLIGRLTKGAVKWKMREGGYWECGVFHEDIEDVKNLALKYAYEIVRAVHEVSDGEGTHNRWTLNAWGLAGTMKNESQWDRCAFGTHPRKAAYKMGLLERRKRCISHTEEDVIAAVTNPSMQKYFNDTGFDLGTCQLLSRFYDNPKDYKYMLSIRGSTYQAAKEMRRRSRRFDTKRPWAYWRGSHTEWYDEKITRWARGLGATKKEI